MSAVHGAVRRAHAAGLLVEAAADSAVVTPALREFLIHGAKYAFPAERGAAARGIPTAHGAASLANAFPPSEDAVPVWPHPQGTVFGQAFRPIHPAAPDAAQTDPLLYEVLALLDALRGGRARDRKLAGELLEQRVR
jgi:hypothetical protein